jgi:hypothetical protein
MMMGIQFLIFERILGYREVSRASAACLKKQVRAGTVAVKFEMEGQSNPVVTAQGKHHQKISQLIEGYRRHDPAPKYKLAVPLTVPTYMYNYGKQETPNTKQSGTWHS